MSVQHTHNPGAQTTAGSQAAAVVSNCCNSCHNGILNSAQDAREVLAQLEQALPRLRQAAAGQTGGQGTTAST